MPILFRENPALLPRRNSSLDGSKIFVAPAPERITVRQSVFFIILNFILIEFFFDSVYLLIRIPISLMQLPNKLQTLLDPWFMVLFAGLTILKLILMISIALKWTSTSYQIGNGEIKHKTGVFNKEEESYMCSFAQEVTFKQGFIGRICNFGSVEIYNPAIKDKILLDSIPNPKKYVEIVKNNIPKDTAPVGYIAG